jgi:hypothetical protein
MRLKHIIFILILLVTAFVVVLQRCNSQKIRVQQSNKKKSYSVDSVVPVVYKESRVVEFEGSIKPIGKVNVNFSIPGTLVPGEIPLSVGKIFRESDILFKLDLRGIFKEISAKKKELKLLAEQLEPEIANNYSGEKSAWEILTSNILPTKRLPACPSFISKSHGPKYQKFKDAYDEVKNMEDGIDAYYYFAPFSGTVIAIKKKIGEKVLSGECVAQIAPFQFYFAEFKIPKEDVFLLKLNDEVSMIQGDKQLICRVAKISEKVDGPCALVECSFSSKLFNNDQKVILRLERNSAYYFVPYHLVRSNGLWIYRSGRSMKIEATILEWKKDSVAIKELKPGDLVLRKLPKSRSISCK